MSCQVELHTHIVLCGDEEEGLGGVERDAHDASAVLAEGVLGHHLGKLVNQNTLRGDRCSRG